MKLHHFLSLAAMTLVLASCGNKNESGSNWNDFVRQAFLATCMKEAIPLVGEKHADSYCKCMQQKVEARYPDALDVGDLTDAQVDEFAVGCNEKADSVTMANTPWSETSRADFVDACVEGAGAELSREEAKAYCTCMQEKVEKKTVNVGGADSIPEEEINRMADDCLGKLQHHTIDQ